MVREGRRPETGDRRPETRDRRPETGRDRRQEAGAGVEQEWSRSGAGVGTRSRRSSGDSWKAGSRLCFEGGDYHTPSILCRFENGGKNSRHNHQTT